jgi:hypothetical protein
MTVTTEFALVNWRKGQAAAEGLAAAYLASQGFKKVDPQSPRGGPDGKKDILCERDGVRYVAACYFPGRNTQSARIKRKFRDDLDGAPADEGNGFIFITNQYISPGDRTSLEKAATCRFRGFYLFHYDSLASFLDSPPGYGLRLEYLDIPMTTAEQVAFFAEWRTQHATFMDLQRAAVDQLSHRLERYIDDRMSIATNLRSSIAALFSMLLGAVPLWRMHAHNWNSIVANFAGVNRKNFDTVSVGYLKYVEGDKELSEPQRRARQNTINAWKHYLDMVDDTLSKAVVRGADLIGQASDTLKREVPDLPDFSTMSPAQIAEWISRLVTEPNREAFKIRLLHWMLENMDRLADTLLKHEAQKLSKEVLGSILTSGFTEVVQSQSKN